jgi:RNA polymerase subunit RPABC4/transcription elongation factor Spt4
MIDLNLDFDEGIVLETSEAIWVSRKDKKLDGFVLTNKNIYCSYKQSTVLFSKPTVELVKLPLSDIKIINNQSQVQHAKVDEKDCLQIQFLQGRELYTFKYPAKKAAQEWVININNVLGTEVAAAPKKANPFGGLSEIAANLKSAADSAMQTVSFTAKQVTEPAKEKAASYEYIKQQPTPQHQTEQASEAPTLAGGSFCVNCGTRLTVGTKFCPSCGTPVGETATATAPSIAQKHTIPTTPPSNSTQRQQEFAGHVLKCPNCGAVISQTTAICPECGIRIIGQAAVSSVQVFSEQLMMIEASRKKAGISSMFGLTVDPADQRKLSLVRSFPIPNTVDDILEFMMLAVANIDVGLSKNTMMHKYQGSMKSAETSATMPKTISDAWVSKMQQVYQKAEVSFPNDLAFSSVKQIYADKMKELKIKI